MKPINSFYNEEKFKDYSEYNRNLLKQELDFLDKQDLYAILQLAKIEKISIDKLMWYLERIYYKQYINYVKSINAIESSYLFTVTVPYIFVDYLKTQYQLEIIDIETIENYIIDKNEPDYLRYGAEDYIKELF